MANELVWQRRIIQSCKRVGGTGRKWSSSMQAGAPDLVLALPGHGVILAEVKVVPCRIRHEYVVRTTRLQKAILSEYENAGARACVLVVAEYPGRGGSYIAAPDLCVVHSTASVVALPPEAGFVKWRGPRTLFDIHTLFEGYYA